MDHKNLTYKTHNAATVMRWRLTIEEFGPELIYIPGNKNIGADVLSYLPLDKTTEDNPNDSYYCANLLLAHRVGQWSTGVPILVRRRVRVPVGVDPRTGGV